MKKNWIRLLTMLLAAMLILTMSGVVSLANDDQPVTGDGVSDVSDTISPVKTEEEPSVDESSTGASSEDEGSKGPSSEDVSSEGSSSEDASSKDTSSEDESSKDSSSGECTCGAAEGEVHKEGCPFYTEPEEKPSEAVQAVIDMIEALPDTDTVANYEPAVDLPEDDEGYNDAYNEAYSAYLEEAKENYAAAQEAYNALTDEEKAEIPEELTGKLADFAGFIAMLGQMNTLDLDNASGGPEYYEEFGTKKAPFFFANGTPITITETGADGMGAKITWDGGEKDVPANTNVFGGYHNSDTSCTTSIIMIGGRLNSLFGGGLHKSHVTKATITISGGAVPGQVAGGGASSMTNGCSDDCSYTNAWYSGDAKDSPCRVDEAVVTIEGGNDYLLVFGGGEGISSTGTATLNISGGDMSGAYVTAGGSNGYTGSGTVNVSGSANIKVLQGVNRGGMDAIKLNVTGGTVKNMYAGGESGDASVTGTFAQSDVTVSGGTVETLRAGTNGGAEITGMNGITAKITPSAVKDNQLTGELVAQIGNVGYPSLAAAITAAKNGDVIKLLENVAEDSVTVDKAVTIDGNGKEFTGTMVVSAGGVTIKNTVFTGTGIVPKEGRNGANHLIKVTCDGTFTFTGNTIRGVDAKTADGQDGIYYDYINIAASGVVTITGNAFDANGGKVYNGIECSQSIPLASGSKIANNTFAKGDCTHNSINIYKVADGGSYDVSGNTFAYSGNAFRLSNYPNADGASPRATFNMNNTTYNETDTTNPGYAGLICLQDPTNQNGKFEDFSKFTIHLANLKGPGGEILTKNELGTAKQVFYVYRDKTGIIEDAAQWPVVPEFINTDEEIAEVVAAAIKAGNDALKAALGDDSTTTLADVTEDDIKAIILSDKGAAFKTAIGGASAMLDKLDAGKLADYLAKNPDLKKQVDALRMSYDIAFTVAPAPSVPEVKATVPADATTAEKQAFDDAKDELTATGNPAAKEPPENLAEAVKGNLPAEATEAALAHNTTEIHVSLETEIHDIAVQEVTNDDGTTTAVVTEIKFEVQPVWLIKDGNDVKAKGAIDSLSGQPVTFKLPIPKSVTDRYAKIVHEYSGGSETFYLEIQKDDAGNQYVDVTVTHFSPFVVTFTNSKPSSGHSSSGGGSGGGSASLDNYDFWAKVQKSIERADGGDVIKANASKALNVPGSVLRALEGRDVTLVISYKGRELAIYGKNMPSIPDNKVYYTFDDLFDLFADYDATVSEIPEAKPGSNPVTGGGYYLPGVTVPTVTLTAELPAVPETPDRISLEPAEKAVEPAVPAEAAPAQASAPAAAHRRLSGVTIALAALIAAVAVGGITTGVWLYKRREQE
ncbi:hypothetical protein [Anaerotruncus massiliensis (ex Togo et al. 2019)]|uniref:hypothetical protein n=1 Tax=Anaerotruncus massiliensis (ex Togo et al. 2019) TaxID=1673720 RepID=UPI0027B98551|nr:hypothetical protein [Anaerotruncus massiliensis (ex Togo et al. 2019)]